MNRQELREITNKFTNQLTNLWEVCIPYPVKVLEYQQEMEEKLLALIPEPASEEEIENVINKYACYDDGCVKKIAQALSGRISKPIKQELKSEKIDMDKINELLEDFRIVIERVSNFPKPSEEKCEHKWLSLGKQCQKCRVVEMDVVFKPTQQRIEPLPPSDNSFTYLVCKINEIIRYINNQQERER